MSTVVDMEQCAREATERLNRLLDEHLEPQQLSGELRTGQVLCHLANAVLQRQGLPQVDVREEIAEVAVLGNADAFSKAAQALQLPRRFRLTGRTIWDGRHDDSLVLACYELTRRLTSEEGTAAVVDTRGKKANIAAKSAKSPAKQRNSPTKKAASSSSSTPRVVASPKASALQSAKALRYGRTTAATTTTAGSSSSSKTRQRHSSSVSSSRTSSASRLSTSPPRPSSSSKRGTPTPTARESSSARRHSNPATGVVRSSSSATTVAMRSKAPTPRYSAAAGRVAAARAAAASATRKSPTRGLRPTSATTAGSSAVSRVSPTRNGDGSRGGRAMSAPPARGTRPKPDTKPKYRAAEAMATAAESKQHLASGRKLPPSRSPPRRMEAASPAEKASNSSSSSIDRPTRPPPPTPNSITARKSKAGVKSKSPTLTTPQAVRKGNVSSSSSATSIPLHPTRPAPAGKKPTVKTIRAASTNNKHSGGHKSYRASSGVAAAASAAVAVATSNDKRTHGDIKRRAAAEARRLRVEAEARMRTNEARRVRAAAERRARAEQKERERAERRAQREAERRARNLVQEQQRASRLMRTKEGGRTVRNEQRKHDEGINEVCNEDQLQERERAARETKIVKPAKPTKPARSARTAKTVKIAKADAVAMAAPVAAEVAAASPPATRSRPPVPRPRNTTGTGGNDSAPEHLYTPPAPALGSQSPSPFRRATSDANDSVISNITTDPEDPEDDSRIADFSPISSDLPPLERLKAVARRLRSGVEPRSHKWWGKKYKKCFAASDAIDFLDTEGLALDRNDAVRICGEMLEQSMAVHILHRTRGFERGSSISSIPPFYRWLDEMYWGTLREEVTATALVSGGGAGADSTTTTTDSDRLSVRKPRKLKLLRRNKRSSGGGGSSTGSSIGSSSNSSGRRCEGADDGTRSSCGSTHSGGGSVLTSSSVQPSITAAATYTSESEVSDWSASEEEDFEKEDNNNVGPVVVDESAVYNVTSGGETSSSHYYAVPDGEPRLSRTKDEYAAEDIYESVESVLSRSGQEPSMYAEVPVEELQATSAGENLATRSSLKATRLAALAAARTASSFAQAQENSPPPPLPPMRGSRRPPISNDAAITPCQPDYVAPVPFAQPEYEVPVTVEAATTTSLSLAPPSVPSSIDTDGGVSLLTQSPSNPQVPVSSVSAPGLSPSRQPQRLWRDRADVLSSGVLSRLDKREATRQEAIAELVYSEEAYLSDLRVLKTAFLLPLEAHARTSEFSGGNLAPPLMDRDTIRALLEQTTQLINTSSEFLGELRERQAEAAVVEEIGDVLLKWQPPLHYNFGPYCELAIQAGVELDQRSEAFASFLEEAEQQPAARGLPMNAFVLSPVQRVARYPLLVKAIAAVTNEGSDEAEAVASAQVKLTESVRACNERMRIVEQHLELIAIANSLDNSRLEETIELPVAGRCLLKRDTLQLVRLATGRKGVAKSKPVELMLFSDMLLYAKPVKVRKTGSMRYIVYQQAHRSLVSAGRVPPNQLPESAGGAGSVDDLNNVCFSVTIYTDGAPQQLVFRAASATAAERWLETFDPAREEDEVYAIWDCPRARALYNYGARGADELSFTAGDLINITNRGAGDGWAKGALVALPSKQLGSSSGNQMSGWFPLSYVEEIDATVHEEAKRLRGGGAASGVGSSSVA